MVGMCFAPPLVQQTIKLPQILLLNSSGGGFSDQGPLVFISGFQGLQVLGLVCKSLATAFCKSATLLKRLVRRNLTLKLVPFTFDEDDFSKLLREHKVDLVGTFPNECVSGLKTPIVDMLRSPDVAPYFCNMRLNVREGQHADALFNYLGDNLFWKVRDRFATSRADGTNYFIRYVNSANVLVIIYIIYDRYKEDLRNVLGDECGLVLYTSCPSFVEARFNGDCFTFRQPVLVSWRRHSTGTYYVV